MKSYQEKEAACEVAFRKLSTLQELRIVILYVNRNGFVVHPEYSPFTYPWGANRYIFNPDSRALANIYAKQISLRERRRIIHSRLSDSVEGLKSFEGCALPTSFCNISAAESLFTDASSYFFRIGKCIEASKEIASELKESVFYTDDELFSSICQISHVRYGTRQLSQLPADSKLELARIMRSDYNASAKQIIRFLKLPQSVLESIGIK